jgi:hypothetical protein
MMTDPPDPRNPHDVPPPDDCECIYCTNKKTLKMAMARTPEEVAKHSREEGEKFAACWTQDWYPLFREIMERTGLSLAEVMAFMAFQQMHGARLALMRMVDGAEKMGQWAREQHRDDDDEWKQP